MSLGKWGMTAIWPFKRMTAKVAKVATSYLPTTHIRQTVVTRLFECELAFDHFCPEMFGNRTLLQPQICPNDSIHRLYLCAPTY
jgi:hypothetical protein